MEHFTRFGLYVVPEGALFEKGSAWLGWNSATGEAVTQPQVAGVEDAAPLTAVPRKYGLHGTIKPPFVLAEGRRPEDLHAAAQEFCAKASPVSIPQIELRRLGRFIAIVPSTPSEDLAELAAETVRALDMFRAPPSEAELTRRRAKGLSPRQDALLVRWGYPYVMEEFRFHITLTGPLKDPDPVHKALDLHFAPVLQGGFAIRNLALMGEDDAGMFHLIHRYALSG